MKKILLVILCITSFANVERLYAQDMDEFDIHAKGGLDGKCDCGENFKFGAINFNTVNNQIASAAAIQAAVYSLWLDAQETIIFNELEKLYRTDFFNFHDASVKVLRDNTVNQGSYWKNHLSEKDKPQYYNSIENKKFNLVELQHLKIRRDEIKEGNINSSVFSFSKVDGEFLKDIKDISKLNQFQKRIEDYYRVNANTEFIAREFRSKINRFDRLGFDSYMSKKLNDYWSDLNRREDRIYLSQFYTNMYLLRGVIDANTYKEYEDSNRKVIKDMPKGRSGNVLGFVWDNMPNFDVNFEDLLDSFTEDDILADLRIVGLGERNNGFLDARPDLRNEIAEYFKENDFSQVSHNAINYLLNEYLGWRDFVVDYTVFESRYPSYLRDENNPERALEFCYEKDAKNHGLPGFGNVLAEFFNNEENPNTDFEGYIIRNILDIRGIDVPSEVPSWWYGENFKFVPHDASGCIKINFDNGNNSFTPTWIFDRDRDGYHAEGTTPVEQVNSPGDYWRMAFSKGVDCDDNNDKISKECGPCTYDNTVNCSDIVRQAIDLMNNPPPIGVSREVIIDYEKDFVAVIEKLGGESNQIIASVYGEASENDRLDLFAHSKILDNIESTLDASFPVDFNVGNITDAEGIRIITHDTVETAAISDMPTNAELDNLEMGFSDYLSLAEPFLVEALIAFIPGGDIIDLVRSIQGGDNLGVAFAIAGIVTTAVGGTAIKGALKSIKVFNRVTRILNALGTLAKAAARATRRGFQTTLDNAGRLILRRGDNIVARGDDLVKKFLDIKNLPKGSRPDPSTYLDPSYITKHLAKFKDGASRIVKKSDFDEFGIGKPDIGKTEFVATKADIDEILKLPIEKQAEKLGIPVDQLRDGQLVRVDFPGNKVEMPSGNEWGANDQWLPGGVTSGGVDEAIVKTEGMVEGIDYIVKNL